MDFSQMKEQLRQSLQPKRFEHSVAVSETAVALARHYGVDEDKAALAGLLHDCARKYSTKDFVEVSKKLASRSRISKRRSHPYPCHLGAPCRKEGLWRYR